jgi:hypothetical protein
VSLSYEEVFSGGEYACLFYVTDIYIVVVADHELIYRDAGRWGTWLRAEIGLAVRRTREVSVLLESHIIRKRDLSEKVVEESSSILEDLDEAILSNRSFVLNNFAFHDDGDVLSARYSTVNFLPSP